MRYVVTDASGVILRQGYATNPAEQATGTDMAFVIDGGNGAVIPDADVAIDPMTGEFVAVGAYAGPLPDGDLQQVAPE